MASIAWGCTLSELYARVLLWHKLVAQTTGGLALCSAKKVLNRTEATSWVAALRNVSDEIQSVLDGAGFLLDSKGQRVVDSALSQGTGASQGRDNSDAETPRRRPQFFDSKGAHDVELHTNPLDKLTPKRAVSPKKAGGPSVAKQSLRVATRKTQ